MALSITLIILEVKDYLPLQQGLRLVALIECDILFGQRLSSITTRIKTTSE